MSGAVRFVGLLGMLVAVATMALLVVHRAEEKRQLVDGIEDELRRQNQELVDYRYLLIERASLSGFHDVENVALEQGMQYPDELRRVRR